MTTSPAGNVLQLLRWTYVTEAASSRFSGPSGAYGYRSSTDIISQAMRLGTIVDSSGAGAVEAAKNHHQDAEIVADLVENALSSRGAKLVRMAAKGEWLDDYEGIVSPTSVAGPLSPNPHKGQSYSWPFSWAYKGQAKSGSQRTPSDLSAITIQNDWAQQLEVAKRSLIYRQSIATVLDNLPRIEGQFTLFRLDLTPPAFAYPTSRIEGDVKVLTRRADEAGR